MVTLSVCISTETIDMLQKFPRIHATDTYNDTENLDKYYCPGDDLADLISAAHHSRLSAGKLFPHLTTPHGKRGKLNGDQFTAGPTDRGNVHAAASFGLDLPRGKRRTEGCLVSHLRHSGVTGRGGKTPILRSTTFQLEHARRDCDESIRRMRSGIAACPPDLAPPRVTLSQANGKGEHHLAPAPKNTCDFPPGNQHKNEVHDDADDLPGSPQMEVSKTDCANPAEESEVASSENHLIFRSFKTLRGSDEVSILDDPASDKCPKGYMDHNGDQDEPDGAAPLHDTVCQGQDTLVSLLKASAFKDHREALERELLEFINMT